MAEIFQILVAIPDAMMRTPANRRPKRHHDFIRGGRVGHRELDRQVMRAATLVVFVHQRDHDRRIRLAARVAKGQIALRADRMAVMVAKTQRVDQRGGVFTSPSKPTIAALP